MNTARNMNNTNFSEWAKRQYKERANSSYGWIKIAEEYKKASQLSNNTENILPYMMLCGHAIECLIKGIYTSKNGAVDESQSDLRLKECLKRHTGLRELIPDCIELSEKDNEYIYRVGYFVESWSRYPVSNKMSQDYNLGNNKKEPICGKLKLGRSNINSDIESIAISPTYSPSDNDTFLCLYEKLMNNLTN